MPTVYKSDKQRMEAIRQGARKGGAKTSKNRKHMKQIGKLGGLATNAVRSKTAINKRVNKARKKGKSVTRGRR